MKRNKNKRAAYAESKEEFTRYMRTYCEMQLGWQHPLSRQTPLWWGAQYDVIQEQYSNIFTEEEKVRLEKLEAKLALFKKETPVPKEKIAKLKNDCIIQEPEQLFERKPILKIQKIGSQWHDTQEWTGEFHGIMGKVVMHA